MRVLRLCAVLTCPLLATASIWEWRGIWYALAFLVATVGAIGTVITKQHDKEDARFEAPITLNLHRH